MGGWVGGVVGVVGEMSGEWGVGGEESESERWRLEGKLLARGDNEFYHSHLPGYRVSW